MNKKGIAIGVVVAAAILIVVMILVIISFGPKITKLGKEGIPQLETKCGLSGKTASEYKTEIPKASGAEKTKLCDEFKKCFPEEYTESKLCEKR